jgi:hypothetical protein
MKCQTLVSRTQTNDAHIKEDVNTEDSKIPPVMRIRDIECRSEELIGRPARAEFASARGIRIGQITTFVLYVSRHV